MYPRGQHVPQGDVKPTTSLFPTGADPEAAPSAAAQPLTLPPPLLPALLLLVSDTEEGSEDLQGFGLALDKLRGRFAGVAGATDLVQAVVRETAWLLRGPSREPLAACVRLLVRDGRDWEVGLCRPRAADEDKVVKSCLKLLRKGQGSQDMEALVEEASSLLPRVGASAMARHPTLFTTALAVLGSDEGGRDLLATFLQRHRFPPLFRYHCLEVLTPHEEALAVLPLAVLLDHAVDHSLSSGDEVARDLRPVVAVVERAAAASDADTLGKCIERLHEQTARSLGRDDGAWDLLRFASVLLPLALEAGGQEAGLRWLSKFLKDVASASDPRPDSTAWAILTNFLRATSPALKARSAPRALLEGVRAQLKQMVSRACQGEGCTAQQRAQVASLFWDFLDTSERRAAVREVLVAAAMPSHTQPSLPVSSPSDTGPSDPVVASAVICDLLGASEEPWTYLDPAADPAVVMGLRNVWLGHRPGQSTSNIVEVLYACTRQRALHEGGVISVAHLMDERAVDWCWDAIAGPEGSEGVSGPAAAAALLLGDATASCQEAFEQVADRLRSPEMRSPGEDALVLLSPALAVVLRISPSFRSRDRVMAWTERLMACAYRGVTVEGPLEADLHGAVASAMGVLVTSLAGPGEGAALSKKLCKETLPRLKAVTAAGPLQVRVSAVVVRGLTQPAGGLSGADCRRLRQDLLSWCLEQAVLLLQTTPTPSCTTLAHLLEVLDWASEEPRSGVSIAPAHLR
jgi:hypothetical protein